MQLFVYILLPNQHHQNSQAYIPRPVVSVGLSNSTLSSVVYLMSLREFSQVKKLCLIQYQILM